MVGRSPPRYDSPDIIYQPIPEDDERESTEVRTSSSDEDVNPERGGNFVYFCFLLLGLGTLLPWNFYITSDSYWQYKFRNVSEGSPWQKRETELQKLYDPMLVCTSQLTNFVFLFINAWLFIHLLSQKARLMGSLLILLCFFIVTTALVKVNTDTWQEGFFAFNMIIIFVMSASTAIFQGSLFGVAGRFPQRFINAVSSGQALGGVFASLARIGSVFLGFNDVTSAFIFFSIAVAVMGFTMVELLFVVRMPFFKRFCNEHCLDQTLPVDLAPPVDEKQRKVKIFKTIWPIGLTAVGVFTVTLSIFPVLCLKVLSSSSNSVWTNLYFHPVATFFVFNVGDYLGRTLAEFFLWPKRGSRLVYLLAALRVIFVPLILLCHHDPQSMLPSVFIHDAWYIVFIAFFGFTNGHLASLCMMYGPRMVPEGDAEEAAGMMAAMIGLGLLLGSLISFGFSVIH